MRGVNALGVLKQLGEDPTGLAVRGESERPLVMGRGGYLGRCGATPLWVDGSLEVLSAAGLWWVAEGGKEMTDTRTGEVGDLASGGITFTTCTGLSTLENTGRR